MRFIGHKECSKRVIKNAKEVCQKGSLNLTPIRKKVLEIIASNHKPARAYDILAKLKDGGFSDKPPTVYRALDFLIENKMVHKLSTINAYVACFNNEVEEVSCFLICEKCQDIEEFQDEGIIKAMANIGKNKNICDSIRKVKISFCFQKNAGFTQTKKFLLSNDSIILNLLELNCELEVNLNIKIRSKLIFNN
jgi:Fur family zinc uptake transcriptional regulator